MKIITDIIQQKNNAKRVSIYLNGAYYCGLDLLTTVKYRLKVGSQITEEELINIQYEAEYRSALDSALTLVSKAYKTEKQVKDKLLKKGYLEEIVLKVIQKLKEYGYVNDEDYAKRYVNSVSGKGKKLIKLELIKKGVTGDALESAVSSIEGQLESAKQVAEKYLKNKEINRQNLLKCYKYLLSKGFSYDDAKSVVNAFGDIEN
ncbi:MAG: RecX family transcriptional regulator [Clostridia bacterium]|nr:RecX family transcriptional regulator [Clostridia bacterium]